MSSFLSKLVIIITLLQYKTDLKIPEIDILSPPRSGLSNLSDIAVNVGYIPLETLDASIVDNIHLFKVRNNFFYVGTLKNIFCFNSSGKFLFKLDKSGRGPEEYEGFNDFDIDSENKYIVLSANKELVLFQQSSSGFSFYKKIKLIESPEIISFTGPSKNILVQYSNVSGVNTLTQELISITGKSLRIWPNYMKYVKKPGMTIMWKNEITSFRNGDNFFSKDIGNDTIFKYNEMDGQNPFIILNSKHRRLTPEVRSDVFHLADHMNEYFTMQRLLGTNRYLYYIYKLDQKINHEVLDLQNKIRYKVSEKYFLKDDISGGVNFEPRYCYNGLFYSWIEANKLKSYAATDAFKAAKVKNSAKFSSLRSQIETLSEFDNPVIIVVTVKN